MSKQTQEELKKNVKEFWDRCDAMFGPPPTSDIRQQLDNLSDELIDNIINTPDEEILKEVEEDYGDSSFLANRAREILKTSKKSLMHNKLNKIIQRNKEGWSLNYDDQKIVVTVLEQTLAEVKRLKHETMAERLVRVIYDTEKIKARIQELKAQLQKEN